MVKKMNDEAKFAFEKINDNFYKRCDSPEGYSYKGNHDSIELTFNHKHVSISIRNEKLFELFEGHTIDNIMDCIDKVVYRCISIKKDVVEADEFDKGERMILNFGHTLGHAIEKFYDYKISHGNAVAIGMCLITECAYKAGICDVEVLNRLISCIKAYNLPYKLDANINALVDLCSNDKKRQSDKISFIVCSKIGHSIIKKTSVDDFRSFILK